jgi:hypothetical protein
VEVLKISKLFFWASGASLYRNWSGRTIEILRSSNTIEKNK